MGFKYADITENNDGATLVTEYGFFGTVSLDANPHDVKWMFEKVIPSLSYVQGDICQKNREFDRNCYSPLNP